MADKTFLAQHYLKAYYPLFRFALDPRWHLYNKTEAITMGTAQSGLGATQQARAWDRAVKARETPYVSDAYRAHTRGNTSADLKAEQDLAENAVASGQLDSRHIAGYAGAMFDRTSPNAVRRVLEHMAANDPALAQARKFYGDTPQQMVNGILDSMYRLDTQRADQAIEELVGGVRNDAMDSLYQKVWRANMDVKDGIANMLHGNTNRGDLERTLNSYFIYWPLSYQLKAAKALVEILTHQAGGFRSNLGGAAILNQLQEQHLKLMKDDPAYSSMFVDNPLAWQVAGMILPITPWDAGIGLSKMTDYIGSSVGAALGLWSADPSKPSPLSDPGTFTANIMKMGPVYTVDLMRRAFGEMKDNPKPNEYLNQP